MMKGINHIDINAVRFRFPLKMTTIFIFIQTKII